jgi:hypothetical protein
MLRISGVDVGADEGRSALCSNAGQKAYFGENRRFLLLTLASELIEAKPTSFTPKNRK